MGSYLHYVWTDVAERSCLWEWCPFVASCSPCGGLAVCWCGNHCKSRWTSGTFCPLTTFCYSCHMSESISIYMSITSMVVTVPLNSLSGDPSMHHLLQIVWESLKEQLLLPSAHFAGLTISQLSLRILVDYLQINVLLLRLTLHREIQLSFSVKKKVNEKSLDFLLTFPLRKSVFFDCKFDWEVMQKSMKNVRKSQ